MLVRSYELEVRTEPNFHVVDVTPAIRERLGESGLREGVVNIFNVGSTGAVTTIEYEPGLVEDFEDLFESLAPADREYHHEKAWHDGNGFSHMRASLLKPSLTVPVVAGELKLGTWQQIVLINFDNRTRRRELVVQMMGVGDGS